MKKEGVRHFEANSPSRIVDYLESKRLNIEEKIVKIKEEIPKIEKLREAAIEKQEAKVYVGLKAIQTFYFELLNNKQPHEEYLAITLAGTLWNKEIEQFLKSVNSVNNRIDAYSSTYNNTMNPINT